MPPTLLAFPPALSPELLTYVLSQSFRPITLIICQPRGKFLSSLQVSVTPTQLSLPQDEAQDADTEQRPLNPLLIPTLRQIATSRSIKLVFIPTVSHLRAYLAVFPSPDDANAELRGFDEKAKERSLLVVYGLVELHRDTSEWSAQGLGNSIAGLVEAGWRGQREVVVIEERKFDQDDILELEALAMQEEEMRRRDTSKVWEQRVPMLNGSVKRAGMESEDGGWSGRTVEVGRILGRWFRFEKGKVGVQP
jgi:hypothetical protein